MGFRYSSILTSLAAPPGGTDEHGQVLNEKMPRARYREDSSGAMSAPRPDEVSSSCFCAWESLRGLQRKRKRFCGDESECVLVLMYGIYSESFMRPSCMNLPQILLLHTARTCLFGRSAGKRVLSRKITTGHF